MSEDIIERLNAQIKEIRAAWAFETTALREENTRLRMLLVEAQDYIDNAYDPLYISIGQELESLKRAAAIRQKRSFREGRMGDIVSDLQSFNEEKLNSEPYTCEEIAKAAADEITRLREEISRLTLAFVEAKKKAERDYLRFVDADREEIERLRKENARLEESNKKLNDDLFKQAELTAVTMTRCADLMPAQLAIVKLKEQQVEIEQLRKENARLRKLLFDFEKFQEIYEKAMEAK